MRSGLPGYVIAPVGSSVRVTRHRLPRLPASTDPAIRHATEEIYRQELVAIVDSDPDDLDSVEHEMHSDALAREPLPPWFGSDPPRGPSASELAEWARQYRQDTTRA